jgi:hypothetical protein
MYAIFKSKTFVFLTFIFLLSVAFPTLAELSSADKEALQQQVTEIRVAVNRGDPDIIAPLLSPNTPAELRNGIGEAIGGKNTFFQPKKNPCSRATPKKRLMIYENASRMKMA